MRSLLLSLGATSVALAGCTALVTFDASDRPPPPDVGAAAGSANAGAAGASAGAGTAGKAAAGSAGTAAGQAGAGQAGVGQAGASGQGVAGTAGAGPAGSAGGPGGGSAGAPSAGSAGTAGGSSVSGSGGAAGATAGKGGAPAGCMGDAECNDGEPCTIDGCTMGTCKHTPVMPGTGCSDGDACNGVETCTASGSCVAGAPPVVDDGNDCTIDACDAKTGVSHTTKATSDVCGSVCPSTFHINGHKNVPMCGSPGINAVVCAPTCGNTFEACGEGCPLGWHATARKCRMDCGACDKDLGNAVSCVRDAKMFDQCGDVCPPGYQVSAPMCSSQNPCYLGPMGTCPANPANLEVTCTQGM